jgi:hypothetical protein
LRNRVTSFTTPAFGLIAGNGECHSRARSSCRDEALILGSRKPAYLADGAAGCPERGGRTGVLIRTLTLMRIPSGNNCPYGDLSGRGAPASNVDLQCLSDFDVGMGQLFRAFMSSAIECGWIAIRN